MKKTLLLIALFSLNLYGADRTFFSLNGLEGWGKGGVRILVDDYSKFEKTFDKKAIESQVEFKLRLAGFNIANKSNHYFFTVNALPVRVRSKVVGYALIIEAKRMVSFEANSRTYLGAASLWDYARVAPASKLGDSIEKYMDKFLLDYIKANPKKKE